MAGALVEMKGHKKLNKRLHKLAKSVKKPSGMFKAIVVEVEKQTLINIRRQGKKFTPGGWKPFKPFMWKGKLRRGRMMKGGSTGKDYPKWKWRVDGRAKLLQDTGHLSQSIRRYYTARQGKVFTRLDYAIAHHTGKGPLPKRQIIPRAMQVKGVAMKQARLYVEKQVAKANRGGV